MVQKLTGWWDQIEGDALRLAETITKTIDPLIDNKRALAQMLREDPTKQQSLVDLDTLNPGVLEQMYGSQVATNIKKGASASTAARTELAGRNISGKPLNTDTVKTVADRAALAKAGVQTPEQLAGDVQQGEYYGWRFSQEKFDASLANADKKRQFDELESFRQQIPELKAVNLKDLAKKTLERSLDEIDNKTLELLRNDSPAGYELYEKYLQFMNEAARDDVRLAQDQKQFKDRMSKEDMTFRRQAAMLANETAVATGEDRDELFKYFFEGGQPDPNIQARFERNNAIKEGKVKLENLSKVSGLVEKFQKAENQEKEIAKAQLENGLQAAFGAPIRVVKAPDKDTFNPWDKKFIYQLATGETMSGEQLFELSTSPGLYNEMIEDSARIINMTPEQAQAEIKVIVDEQLINVNPKRFERILKLLREKTGVSASSTPDRRPRR